MNWSLGDFMGEYLSVEFNLRQIPRPSLTFERDGDVAWLNFSITTRWSDPVLSIEVGFREAP